MGRLVFKSEHAAAECWIIELVGPPLPVPLQSEAYPFHRQLPKVDSSPSVAPYKFNCRYTVFRNDHMLAILSSGN